MEIFPKAGEKILNVKWNEKSRRVNILKVRDIYPPFIVGIDIMKTFGIKLIEGNNNIKASYLKQNH